MFRIPGVARAVGMSYGYGRISTLLIPDNSKPTVTWGRKAMGLVRCSPSLRTQGRQVAEGILS